MAMFDLFNTSYYNMLVPEPPALICQIETSLSEDIEIEKKEENEMIKINKTKLENEFVLDFESVRQACEDEKAVVAATARTEAMNTAEYIEAEARKKAELEMLVEKYVAYKIATEVDNKFAPVLAIYDKYTVIEMLETETPKTEG